MNSVERLVQGRSQRRQGNFFDQIGSGSQHIHVLGRPIRNMHHVPSHGLYYGVIPLVSAIALYRLNASKFLPRFGLFLTSFAGGTLAGLAYLRYRFVTLTDQASQLDYIPSRHEIIQQEAALGLPSTEYYVWGTPSPATRSRQLLH